MLNLFNLLSVAWPCFDMILSIGALLNFKLDHLSLSCVSTVSAFMEFAGTVCGFLILIFAIVAIHVSCTLVALHRSKRRRTVSPLCLLAPSELFSMQRSSACQLPFSPPCSARGIRKTNSLSTPSPRSRVGAKITDLLTGTWSCLLGLPVFFPFFFVLLHVGRFFFARVYARRRHCLLAHVRILVLPILIGHVLVRSGRPVTEPFRSARPCVVG